MPDIYEWDASKPESEIADLRRRVEALEARARPVITKSKPTRAHKIVVWANALFWGGVILAGVACMTKAKDMQARSDAYEAAYEAVHGKD